MYWLIELVILLPYWPIADASIKNYKLEKLVID